MKKIKNTYVYIGLGVVALIISLGLFGQFGMSNTNDRYAENVDSMPMGDMAMKMPQTTPIPAADMSMQNGTAETPIVKTPVTEKPVTEEPAAENKARTVSISQYAYGPQTLTVKKGTRVTWVNRDIAKHTVTADDGSFDSTYFGKGESFSTTFNTTGTFPYHCSPHPYMKATVVVTE